MHKFNLHKFRKKAFYEGAKGQMFRQKRVMMDCYKAKLKSGQSAQEAWQNCLDEFNDSADGNWATKYA